MINNISVIGTDIEKQIEVAISNNARRQQTWIIGSTGTGKSTLIASLILQQIHQNHGVCLVEPHSDLTNNILERIPSRRLQDIIYFDVGNTKNIFGLNLFEAQNPDDMTEVAKVSSFLNHVFATTWQIQTSTAPHLTQLLRNVTRTLIEAKGTFADIPLLLWDEAVRQKLTKNLKNTQTKLFWQQYNRRTPRSRDDYISSLINKIDSYLNNPIVANMLSQRETTIDFREIIDSGKILLLKLSNIHEEVSRLIGAIIIGNLLMASFSRASIKEENRRPFYLFIDEFQKFSNPDFRAFIEEARKYQVSITLSHQSLKQLDEESRSAASGAANIIVFRVSGDDGRILARSFDTTPTREIVGQNPERAPVGNVIEYLIKRGHSDPRVTRFAQAYLVPLENFIRSIPQGHERTITVDFSPQIDMKDIYFRKGRELINEALYRPMVDRKSDFIINPLALFILALSQRNYSEQLFIPYVKHSWAILPVFEFEGFKKEADIFGDPWFITEDNLSYISKKKRKNKEKAEKLIAMITELRYTMDVLANDPIMIDTGRYTPRYQQRLYSDMQNEIANRLKNQQNYEANVKLLSGEHIIRTYPLSPGLTGHNLESRIEHIQKHMRNAGYTRYYKDVEREVRERQEILRRELGEELPPTRTVNKEASYNQAASNISRDEPPPTHT
jgi:GTPase SAR1 family protein